MKKQNSIAYPDKTKPLINFIDNPSFAKNLLMSVGLVETEEQAKNLQNDLLPGQALTTKGGGLWRWDGFIIPPGSSSPSSEILKQTNRMRLLENEKINSYKKLQNDESNFNNCYEYFKKIQSDINSENSNLAQKKEDKLRLEFELNKLISKESNKKEKSDLIQREVTNIESRINEIDKILNKNSEISSLNTKLKSINIICTDLKEKLSNIITDQAKLEQNKIFCVNRINDIKKEKRVPIDEFYMSSSRERITHDDNVGIWYQSEAKLPEITLSEVMAGFNNDQNLSVRLEKLDETGHKIILSREEAEFKLASATRVVKGANLMRNEYGNPLFADFFFFITGFHGFHVFSGVILNIIVFINVLLGTYERRGHYDMVEKVGLYWHFVDLVWVFVFTFFYLV